MILIKIINFFTNQYKYEILYESNERKIKSSIIGKIILILFLLFFYYYFNNIINNRILIEVDIFLTKIEGGGPVQLQKGLSKVLPYKTKKCRFIARERIYPTRKRKEINYFFKTAPCMSEKTFERWKSYKRAHALLLGPCFVPNFWSRFPMDIYWKERRFREVLLTIKAVVVHSTRVRDHLASRSNNTDLLNKFILMRPCSYFRPKDIKPFKERSIDIILYEKYPDSDRRMQGKQLLELLNSTGKKIESLVSGNYTRDTELILASDAKFVIHFSFYDTGALSLK